MGLRIAFIYDVIYPWVKGGVERRIYELARRLASLRVKKVEKEKAILDNYSWERIVEL